ncbi:MAG: class I SAM-dependent methyltransferase [Erythrobacter sp.]|nr:class I SAM-dependent methyltransferase [Erythrobacter sp.]
MNPRIKALGHRVFDVGFKAKVAAGKALGLIDFPVPPRHNLTTTSSNTVRHYFQSGLTTIQPILMGAMAEGFEPDEDTHVLDFGCGVGRQLLHLKRWFPAMKISAIDVDREVVDYVARTFPGVDAYCNDFDPPLKFADNSFDLIYSVSIFSHLSMDDAKLWLTDLARVAKPGSVLCLTFNSAHSLGIAHADGRRLQFTQEQLQGEGFILDGEEISEEAAAAEFFGKKARGIKRSYGETYYSHDKFGEVARSCGLTPLRMYPAVIDRHQDLAVFRA